MQVSPLPLPLLLFAALLLSRLLPLPPTLLIQILVKFLQCSTATHSDRARQAVWPAGTSCLVNDVVMYIHQQFVGAAAGAIDILDFGILGVPVGMLPDWHHCATTTSFDDCPYLEHLADIAR